MNDLLKNILSSMDQIDGWHILTQEISSNELFYIKQNLDMNRIKDVVHYQVTVYKDFEEDGNKYKGSSTVKIAPTLEAVEIKEILHSAAFASTFVKNQYYPLLDSQLTGDFSKESSFGSDSLQNWMPKLTEALFKNDDPKTNPLNSSELFLNKCFKRIQNSNGLDVTFTHYNGNLEFIANWTGKEEVETYKNIDFADFKPELIASEVKSLIEITKEKTNAVSTPSLEGVNVLLTGGPVKEFFTYYLLGSGAKSVYEEISQFKISDPMQGDKIIGDKVSITIDPNLENSTLSKAVDQDGYQLKKVKIIEDGKLLRFWGDCRYSHYLGVEPTGALSNYIVDSGTLSIDELKSDPYIELVEFSDFQMNPMTGDFAGEIRLGRYFDGEKIIPVTTGSLSGNIRDVQENMFLSKEQYQDNNYLGPKTIKLCHVNIAGN